MKKLLVVAIILIFSVIPLCAEGQIGVTLTPEFGWITEVVHDEDLSAFETNFILSIDGANYFPQAYGFGIEYGLGLYFPWMYWEDKEANYFDSTIGLSLKLGATYRYAFSDFIGISAGIGLASTYFIFIDDPDAQFNLDMYGKVAADFTFIDALRVNAGLAVVGNLCMIYFCDYHSAAHNLDTVSFSLSPFVSVSYLY